jgi:SAM-dependent methyltransferase
LQKSGNTNDNACVACHGRAMTRNEQQIVLSGYDIVADAYFEKFGVSTVRQKWLDRLKVVLPLSGGRVLDLGCGAGVPVAWDLAAAGHSVIGVDGSALTDRRNRSPELKKTYLPPRSMKQTCRMWYLHLAPSTAFVPSTPSFTFHLDSKAR